MVRSRWIAAAVIAVAITGAGAGLAVASGGGDDIDKAITGVALEQASTAALASTGGGRVTGTEVGDEESYYEVEVTVADGSEVDVQLDESFKVVGSKADRENPAEDASTES